MLCAFSSGTPGGRDKKLLRLLVPNPIKDIICREREVEKGREALAKVSRAGGRNAEKTHQSLAGVKEQGGAGL